MAYSIVSGGMVSNPSPIGPGTVFVFEYQLRAGTRWLMVNMSEGHYFGMEGVWYGWAGSSRVVVEVPAGVTRVRSTLGPGLNAVVELPGPPVGGVSLSRIETSYFSAAVGAPNSLAWAQRRLAGVTLNGVQSFHLLLDTGTGDPTDRFRGGASGGSLVFWYMRDAYRTDLVTEHLFYRMPDADIAIVDVGLGGPKVFTDINVRVPAGKLFVQPSLVAVETAAGVLIPGAVPTVEITLVRW